MAEKKASKPELELRHDDLHTVSSSSTVRNLEKRAAETSPPANAELTGVAAKLASIELPKLERDNRARLLMQSPNRLFFYWSLRSNPFQLVNTVADGTTGYQLVAKLIDLTSDSEAVYPVEASGSWWFDVDADHEYSAEIGLYAPNRPYVRILYSNTVKTPRKRPSQRTAVDSDWIVTSETFADVLSVSGFKKDAFEVALRGDNDVVSESATRESAADLFGTEAIEAVGDNYDEFRSALLHLALGLPLESLKFRVSENLYRLLQRFFEHLTSERTQAVLKERFGVEVEDIFEEEPMTSVHGSSIVNFPNLIRRRRKYIGDYRPVSS